MSKPQDVAFEVLAEVTGSDWTANRGNLNAALMSIRNQSGLDGEELVAEIRTRAADYRTVFEGATLTPTALAAHWKRVREESERLHKPKGTNQHVSTECDTCDGDRMVIVQTRTDTYNGHSAQVEEYAPCPDCNPVVITMRRIDGHKISTPDAGAMREMMRR